MPESNKMEIEYMNSENKVKLLITNDIEPYANDVVRVMAMSPETPYRFRYDEKWLPRLASRIRNGDIKPECKALVVLRQFDTGRLIPIRYVTITEITILGNVFFIAFKPGEFVRLSEDKNERSDQIERFNQIALPFITEDNRYPNNPKEDFLNLFCEVTDKISDIENDSKDITSMQAWTNIVSELIGIRYYQEKGFFRIYSIAPAESFTGKSLSVSTEEIVDVKPNNLYAIRAIHMQHNLETTCTIKTRTFLLDSIDERIIIDKGESTIESSYDVAELRFHLSSGVYKNDTTTLTIRYVDENRDDVLSPLYIPLRIRRSFRTVGVAKGVLLISLLLLWLYLRVYCPYADASGIDDLLVVLMIFTSAFPSESRIFFGLK